ncbi:MAG: thiamine-phosphate kinase [Deltaproteobacteria bacterium]|nr:thiamine-phosphate kinase [Deltaproteobacteria bacterium]
MVAALRRVLDRPHGDLDLPVGNGDDAVVWRPRGQVVATVDSVVEGVDWLAQRTPPEAIGHRAAAVNLSDLAAMGAQPRLLLLSIDAPPTLASDMLVRAARQLADTAADHGAAVHGGDFGLSAGPLRLTVTALGELQGPALRRDVARPGDGVWAVGALGQAAAGLAWLSAHAAMPLDQEPAAQWVRAHLYPQPHVRAGLRLQSAAQAGARLGAIDVSDGLCADAARVAAASRVGMVLHLPEPPWAGAAEALAAAAGTSVADWVGAGGDDYALLVTAAAGVEVAAIVGDAAPCTRIGQCTVGPAGKVFATVGGRVVDGRGYFHGGPCR